MSNLKKVFTVTRIITDLVTGVVATSTVIHFTEEAARENLRDFQKCQQKDPQLCRDYQTVVSGDVDHDHAEAGRKYYGVMYQQTLEADELEDAYKPYTVEVEVTRTYNVTVEIDEAESSNDAEDKARYAIQNGEYDHDMDCPDDEDIDIQDCYVD